MAGVEPPLLPPPVVSLFVFVETRSACTPRLDHPFPVPFSLMGAPEPGKKCTLSLGLGGVCVPKRSASCACETAGEGRKSGGGDAAAPRSSARSEGVGEGERGGEGCGVSGSGLDVGTVEMRTVGENAWT